MPSDITVRESVTRVVVVEDHEVTLNGIEIILARAGIETVGAASTGRDAIRVIEETRPDVVLLDVRLPDEYGLATLRRIRHAFSETPVLILTSHADRVLAQAADSAGAAGFLLKRIDSTQLSEAVQRVAAGERVYDEDLGGVTLRQDKPRDPRLARLSPREHDVLELVAEGLTNREIAGRLSVSQKTAKNYVSSMLKKLDVKTRSAAAALMARIQTERAFHYPPEDWR